MRVDALSGTDAGGRPSPVSDVVCALGEGPTWDADAGVVRWVDIDRGVLYEAPVTGEGVGPTRTVLAVDGTLGAAVHAEGGGFLLAAARHLEHRDASGATVATWELIPEGQPRRLNDGACDPAGRYVVGSLLVGGAPGDEQLWRLEHDGTVTVLDEGLTLSNGIAWSPDGQVMYHVDTRRNRVYARSYDPSTNYVGLPCVLIDTGEAWPDGLTVDSTGDLWVAMWAEGEVRCYAPDGTQRDVLHTGVSLTTSCAFVGPKLDLLVVTSAAGEGSPVSPHADAVDGRLLAVRTPIAGLRTRAWRPCARDSRPTRPDRRRPAAHKEE
ncbi:SMP-30/gluconolactonase/LRE family protein [Demequina sp.]|uniref:SMP-30/gluconolactonase/LRE family protein n=1 Tax=Demequina sp. TaxID=2050685 RepID=UPI0025BF2C57|nr:SMP-30/gluconolactonase/LRE family protein [Demequina sp.]